MTLETLLTLHEIASLSDVIILSEMIFSVCVFIWIFMYITCIFSWGQLMIYHSSIIQVHFVFC